MITSDSSYFRALVQRSNEITVALDRDGAVTFVSSAAQRMLGYTTSWRDAADVFALVHPDDRRRVIADFQDKIEHPEEGVPIVFRFRHAAGTWRHLEAAGTNLLDDEDVGAVVVTLRDVTARVQAEATLRRNELRYRRALEVSPEAIMIQQHGFVVFANLAAMRVLGARHAEDLIGRSVFDVVHPDHVEAIAAQMERVLGGTEAELTEEKLLRVDGRAIDVEVVAVPTEWNGEPAAQVVARDITERNVSRRQLQYQATHDALTGLPNRTLLTDRLDRAIARRNRIEGMFVVVFLDLDRFKVVNDGLGHDAGDELLCQVANRLRAAVRSEDTVARFGGDEFVFIIEDLDSEEAVECALDRIMESLRPMFSLGSREMRVTASAGVVVVDRPHDESDLLRDADAAMYVAKDRGRARFERFGEQLRGAAAHRLRTEQELNTALDADQLVARFQPELDLQSGRVVGAEALVRWLHPVRGELLPGEFLGVLDDAGLSNRLAVTVVGQALDALVEWKRGGAPDGIWISANITAAEILHPKFVARVTTALTRRDLTGPELCLEITESTLIQEPEHTVEVIRALRRLGVTFAVDDFGTGYSSLGYLKRFRPEFVKIDRTFVAGVSNDPGDRAIVKASIDMAHALGGQVIAEGVETTEQLEALRNLGCDMGQGFLFAAAQPLPALMARDRYPVGAST